MKSAMPANIGTLRQNRSSDVTFALKLAVYLALIILGVSLCILNNFALQALGTILLGAMFAHGIELQHQVLHAQGFRDRQTNNAIGILLGVPMLVSFSDYRSAHLHHHKHLGTQENEEFFDYGDQYGHKGLTSVALWAIRLFILSHYVKFFNYAALALMGRDFKKKTPDVIDQMRSDYLIMLTVVIFAVAFDVYTDSFLFTKVWFIPLVIVAGPVHALIEMPEHFQCNTNSTNPYENTRTIKSNAFMYWFTNGNNYHVEHHLMPSLLIDRLHDLHVSVSGECKFLCKDYWEFYRKVIRSMLARN